MKVSHRRPCVWVHLDQGSKARESQEAEGRSVSDGKGPGWEARGEPLTGVFLSGDEGALKRTAVTAAQVCTDWKAAARFRRVNFMACKMYLSHAVENVGSDTVCVRRSCRVRGEWGDRELVSLLWLEEGERVTCRKERPTHACFSKTVTLGHCVFERELNTQG